MILLKAYFLIWFLNFVRSKDVIKTNGIPKHWKQCRKVLNDPKLQEEYNDLCLAKPKHGSYHPPHLTLPIKVMNKRAPLKLNMTIKPVHLLHVNKTIKAIPKEQENNTAIQNQELKIKHNTIKTTSDSNHVKKDLCESKNKVPKKEIKLNTNDKTPISKNATKCTETHHNDNLSSNKENNSTHLVREVDKKVGQFVKNTAKLVSSKEKEHSEGFVDNENSIDKLRDSGNETEIDFLQEPLEYVDTVNNEVKLSKVEETSGNREVYPNWLFGWVRYRFMPNQYCLSDRNFMKMDKVN